MDEKERPSLIKNGPPPSRRRNGSPQYRLRA